jgi:hypothetical protein
VAPFALPEVWKRYGGFDYGWASPSVFVAAAKDGDGRLWVFRELKMVQTPEREQARQVLATQANCVVIAADPSMWGKSGSALPPAAQFATEGCPLEQADNDRLGGKSRIHTYLAEAPACLYHRSMGWDTCPLLHVLDGACDYLVDTMGDLPRDPKRPEDVDTNADDHAYDALRYLVMSVGVEARFHFPPDPVAQPRAIDPQAVGPRPPAPLPTTIGGFPVLNGSNPWG